MKLKKSSVYVLLWILLSTGLLVLNQYQSLKTAVLYGFVPGALFSVFLAERSLRFNNRAFLYLVAFTFWSGLSLLYTVNFDMTSNYLSILIGNLVVWYTVSRIVERNPNHQLLLLLFIGPLVFHSIQGIITPAEVIESVGYGRATGLYSNPNGLGFTMWYGATALILLLLYLPENRLMQLIGIGLIGLFLYVLLQSGSRKNALAFLVFGFILLYYLARSKYRSWVIGFGVMALLGYFVIDLDQLEQTALFARASSEHLERSGEHRFLLILDGWRMFLSNPLLGIGLGSFTFYSTFGQMAHNDVIEVIASTGIVGFVLYAMVYWLFYKQNKILLKNETTYRWGAWSQAFLAGWLVLGMGRPTFLDPVAMMVLAFFYSLSWQKARQLKAHYLYFQKRNNAYLPHHQHA